MTIYGLQGIDTGLAGLEKMTDGSDRIIMTYSSAEQAKTAWEAKTNGDASSQIFQLDGNKIYAAISEIAAKYVSEHR